MVLPRTKVGRRVDAKMYRIGVAEQLAELEAERADLDARINVMRERLQLALEREAKEKL